MCVCLCVCMGACAFMRVSVHGCTCCSLLTLSLLSCWCNPNSSTERLLTWSRTDGQRSVVAENGQLKGQSVLKHNSLRKLTGQKGASTIRLPPERSFRARPLLHLSDGHTAVTRMRCWQWYSYIFSCQRLRTILASLQYVWNHPHVMYVSWLFVLGMWRRRWWSYRDEGCQATDHSSILGLNICKFCATRPCDISSHVSDCKCR